MELFLVKPEKELSALQLIGACLQRQEAGSIMIWGAKLVNSSLQLKILSTRLVQSLQSYLSLPTKNFQF